MHFNSDTALYLQIGYTLCEQLLTGEYQENERILSVRELGEKLKVNPNTILRAYQLLQSSNIIINKRGLGYSVSAKGIEAAKTYLRKTFLEASSKKFFETAMLLNIDAEEVKHLFQAYQSAYRQ